MKYKKEILFFFVILFANTVFAGERNDFEKEQKSVEQLLESARLDAEEEAYYTKKSVAGLAADLINLQSNSKFVYENGGVQSISRDNRITEPVKNFIVSRKDIVVQRLDVGYFSYNNLRRKGYNNQDAASVIAMGTHKDAPIFLSVCDGHGFEPEATKISRRVSKRFSELLFQDPQFVTCNKDKDLYREIAEKLQREVRGIEGKRAAGSTATMVVLFRDKAVFANVGDSRSVLSSTSNGEILFETKDHKPDDVQEQIRIRRVEGCIINDKVGGKMALTRSFGDTGVREFGLTEEPTVTIQDVRGNDFLVLASDGLWDKVSSEEAIRMVLQVLQKGENLNIAAKALADKASVRNQKDDITVLIAKIK